MKRVLPLAGLLILLLPCSALAQAPDSPDWATLDKQAQEQYVQGDLKQAVSIAKLAVAAASGPAQTSRSLDRLGFFQYTAGDLKEAEPSLRKALDIRKTAFGAESAEYAESANDLALFCRDSGKLPEARMLAEQAVDLRRRFFGAENSLLAESLNALGSIFGLMGEYEQAISRFEQARAIHESQPEPRDFGEEYGTLCVNLAGTYQRVGQYGRAEELFATGLKVLRRKPGIHHPAYSASLTAEAYLEAELGHYAAAEKLYAESDQLLREQLGEQHPVYATFLNNRAALYAAMGNVAVAEADYRKALELKRKIYGPDALTIGASLRNLARLTARKDPAQGETLFREAVDLYARNAKAQPFDYGSALLGLAEAQRTRGELADARQSLQRAAEIVARGLGAQHPLYAAVLRDEALVHELAREYPQAQQRLNEAVDIIASSEGANHPDLAQYLQYLAESYEEAGDYRSAEAAYRRSLDISDRALTDILSVGSERAKDSVLANLDDPVSALIGLQRKAGDQVPDARVLAFEAVLRRKGRALDAVHDWSLELQRNSDPAIRERFHQRQALLECEASLTTALGYREIKPPLVGACSLPQTGLEGRYERLLHDLRTNWTPALAQQSLEALKVLQQNRAELEAGLSRDLPRFASATASLRMADIRSRLRPGEMLAEIVSFASRGTGPADRYGAFLLGRSQELLWLDLGPRASTDRGVRDLFAAAEDWSTATSRQELRNQRIAEQTAAESLHTLSRNLAPLITALASKHDIQHLRIAPDGMLNLVPFAALVDSRGRPLIERLAISYLSSSRDLVAATPASPGEPSPGALLVAVSPGGRAAGGSPQLAQAFRSQALAPLRSAVIEAKEVQKWVPGARVLGEGQATEERIKQLHHPALLHIVGHGLVKGNESCAADEPSAICQMGGSSAERVMSLSAIVLEEAYGRGSESSQDGLLTALELQTLDLQGSEMLVLSQCRMADGVPSSADGVFGMRRAAAIAGVRTFVAPLWNIADGPQRTLMNRFYQELSLGTARDEALRRAQLQLLHAATPTTFLTWAPVVLSGDPQPVPGSWFKL